MYRKTRPGLTAMQRVCSAENLRLLTLILTAIAFAYLTVGQVQAQEYVATKGKLSDQDFYRLVACAAPPGGKCQKPFVHWSKSKRRNLTIGIMRIEGGFPARNIAAAAVALENAIGQINKVDAGVRLTQIYRGTPDIKVYFSKRMAAYGPRKTAAFDRMVRAQNSPAMAQVFTALASSTIVDANVVITREVPRFQLKSVVLEEVVQTLGLLTDIQNPYYRKKSIFSETDSAVGWISRQDAKALRMHYPP